VKESKTVAKDQADWEGRKAKKKRKKKGEKQKKNRKKKAKKSTKKKRDDQKKKRQKKKSTRREERKTKKQKVGLAWWLNRPLYHVREFQVGEKRLRRKARKMEKSGTYQVEAPTTAKEVLMRNGYL
jgi:hypothetical protein